MVGTAAIQQGKQGLTAEKMSHMGNSSVLNSYVDELYGIHLALQRICQQRLSTRQICHYIIAVDSQNALRSLVSPQYQSGQFMIKQIVEQIEKLKDSNTYISFRWVPAYEGILGNERAHTLALKTTKTDNLSFSITGLKRLKSAFIRERQKRVGVKWSAQFEKSQTVGVFTQKSDGALLQRYIIRLYNGLSTQESAILIQLRKDHNRL